MDWTIARVRIVPLGAALLVSIGCSVGDPSSGFTSASSITFGPGDSGGSGGTDDPVTTFEPDTGVMTEGATGDSGPDLDTGTDPDSGSGGDSTGPGCMPSEEICDGMDNDCDGVEDNGDPGGGEVCDTGMAGECGPGQSACEAGAVVCNPLSRSTIEICDDLDNDCDGMIDNGNPDGGGSCITGMSGVCASGTEQCQSGSVICEANEMPSAEVCDGEDDDCDGAVDNGNPGGGGACNTGVQGICAAGTNTCVGGMVVCQQDVIAAPDELCGNGLDDDCNGMVDDGCACPFGLCESPGLPQVLGCDPCVDQVCGADAFCCDNQWDAICVGQVETVCMQADCIDPACAHLVCETGVLLDSTCSPCVTSICAADAFCCSNTWDGLCVGAVASVCLLTCPAP